jgi:hypothetical protein
MNRPVSEQVFLAGDHLKLRPVMRTLDGNGWRVALTVQGPEINAQRTFVGQPIPLGGDYWIFGDYEIQLLHPGSYVVDLACTTAWPTQTFTVRYHFAVNPQ